MRLCKVAEVHNHDKYSDVSVFLPQVLLKAISGPDVPKNPRTIKVNNNNEECTVDNAIKEDIS